MEGLLESRIDECFQNENFANLPVSLIFRIVEKSAKRQISCDSLYDFIKKSISKFCTLLQFVDLSKLSNEKLCEICESFSAADESSKHFFNCLKCNLALVKEMNEKIMKMQKSLDDNEAEKDRLAKMNDQIQSQLNDSESAKRQLELEISELRRQLADLETQKNRLQEQLEEATKELNGTIVARVKDGLIFNAQISLQVRNSPLDTVRSKYIVSTSNAKELGSAAYEKGEPITSLVQKTVDFGGKAGEYYVRALVINKNGNSLELVSNPVVTNGSSLNFGYEEKEAVVMLPKGKYKLEVWGASGGRPGGASSSGERSNGLGGKGGYSTGIITLPELDKFHVFVGGAGVTAHGEDGSEAKGGFPDGGGTKTGHKSGYTTVPGTGGGSTSIRVSSNSLHSRVIVAGGGGGAGGDNYHNHGGFGGGLSGGNCYDHSSMKNQGGGTQTGSSPGIGAGSDGVAGSFGKGTDGLYKRGANSGGGGGGGWYGGGGGGHGGNITCSSGGGGSGWVFTEETFNEWKSGDSSNADLFLLKAPYYLANASTIPGDSSFPSANGSGTETGHEGNGYAKITPL